MVGHYFARVHDIIILYSRSAEYTWNPQYGEFGENQLKEYRLDDNGRLYTGQDLTVSSTSASRQFEWRGVKPPPNRAWAFSREKLEELSGQGKIITGKAGKPILRGLKVYLDERPGVKLTTLWSDIGRVGNTSSERLNYPTQKPEALLERIIKASSNEGDLVLDCFCGSGTTAAVSEKLNRRWIAADLGRFTIHTTRKRLLSIPDVRPFVVQNLGKYERQAWQVAEFGQSQQQAAEAQSRYRRFILDLYGAEELSGYIWLHGLKAGHFVHVGSVDAPVVEADVRAIAREFWQAAGKGGGATSAQVDILGWDFAFELNEMGKQMASEANIRLSFKRIPREVLEQKAVEQGDIRFFELAALDVSTGWLSKPPRTLRVTLRDFVVPPDDIPQPVQQAITHWSQLIDYWAVDWDFKEDTFHNQWQSYRTKKQPQLDLAAEHCYDASGGYTVLVKVIDILGNDTTKSIGVEAE